MGIFSRAELTTCASACLVNKTSVSHHAPVSIAHREEEIKEAKRKVQQPRVAKAPKSRFALVLPADHPSLDKHTGWHHSQSADSPWYATPYGDGEIVHAHQGYFVRCVHILEWRIVPVQPVL